MKDYSRIIDLEWPPLYGRSRASMPVVSRAKIFQPFAALRGFEEKIAATGVRHEKEFNRDNFFTFE